MLKSTLADRLLYPVLIVVPAALLPFGSRMNVRHSSIGERAYASAAYYSLMGGGLAARPAGAMDYLTIPSDIKVKRTANVRVALDVGALAIIPAPNVAARRVCRNKPEYQSGSLPLAAASMMVSGWFGARLLYEQGLRAKGMDRVAVASETALLEDEVIVRTLQAEEQHLPANGPLLH